MEVAEARRVLVVLQNAYDKGSLGGGWSRARWVKEFSTSRSGCRLSVMLGDNLKWCRYANTTPAVGRGPDSVLPPSPAHIRRVLKRVEPLVVVACGRQAEAVCSAEWPGDLLVIPHPTFRVLTDALLAEAGRLLNWRMCWHTQPGIVVERVVRGPVCRLLVRQDRGGHTVHALPGHQPESQETTWTATNSSR